MFGYVCSFIVLSGQYYDDNKDVDMVWSARQHSANFAGEISIRRGGCKDFEF